MPNFIPPANGASQGSYLTKNGCFGQKRAKWGQSKQLWHPNLQTFFDEVIFFELVGDDVKIYKNGVCLCTLFKHS